jgi:hypothetical protein
MNRRSLMKMAAAIPALPAAAQAQVSRATRATPSPKIKDVQVIATAPAGLRLVVVKILTDPVHDVMLYWRAPLHLLRGELIDPMEHVQRH